MLKKFLLEKSKISYKNQEKPVAKGKKYHLFESLFIHLLFGSLFKK